MSFVSFVVFPSECLAAAPAGAVRVPYPRPGTVGPFEVGIKILQGRGAPAAAAGSYILVLHAILLVPVTLLGLIFMAREGVRWAEVSQAAQADLAHR